MKLLLNRAKHFSRDKIKKIIPFSVGSKKSYLMVVCGKVGDL